MVGVQDSSAGGGGGQLMRAEEAREGGAGFQIAPVLDQGDGIFVFLCCLGDDGEGGGMRDGVVAGVAGVDP